VNHGPMVKHPLTQIAYSRVLSARFAHGGGADELGIPLANHWPALDGLPPTSSPALLATPDARDRLQGIAWWTFFRRHRTGDGKRIRRLLGKTPSGLGA